MKKSFLYLNLLILIFVGIFACSIPSFSFNNTTSNSNSTYQTGPFAFPDSSNPKHKRYFKSMSWEIFSEERKLCDKNYISFHIDNDVFLGTDYYNTHSEKLSIFFKSWSDYLEVLFPFDLFKNALESETIINISHSLNTPKNIKDIEKQKNDMPFSASLILNLNNEKKFWGISNYVNTFQSEYYIGLMGPIAGGYETQSFIHSWNKNSVEPKGWENQLKNDILFGCKINYNFTYYRFYFSGSKIADFFGTSGIEFGTYKSNYSFGTGISSELFFSKDVSIISKLFAGYNYVIYDSRFAGGAFTRNLYELTNKDTEDFVKFANFETEFIYHNFGLFFEVNYRTKEIKNGVDHSSAGIGIKYKF